MGQTLNSQSDLLNQKKAEGVSCTSRVTIVGGGFSGLTTAYFLVQSGIKVRIFEKNKWGGLIQTRRLAEMQVESAANGFLNSPWIEKISQDIGCELIRTNKEARKRFIFKNGLSRWPLGFFSTLYLIFWVFPFFILNKKKLSPLEYESVAQWSKRVLNQEILDYLIAPALQGIYAGDVNQLSASLLLGHFFNDQNQTEENNFIKKSSAELYKKNKLKGTVTPLNGMGDFISNLKNYLEKSGVEFFEKEFTQSDIELVLNKKTAFDDILILAVQPWNLQNLIDPTWKKIAGLNFVRATVAWKNSNNTIPGFGVLFPPRENFFSLGVLANSVIFSNRGSLYNESWIMGGAQHPEYVNLSDEEILEKINSDRERIFGFRNEIGKYEIVRWKPGICHYTVDLEKFIKKYDFTTLSEKKIFITGNFLGRIGLSKILEQNYLLSLQIQHQCQTLNMQNNF